MWESDTPMIDKLLSVVFRIDAKSLNAINAETFDVICDKMKKHVAVENKQWLSRVRKLENGGSSAAELARQRQYYKRKHWSKRHISKAKKAALAASWAEYDAQKAASQGQ